MNVSFRNCSFVGNQGGGIDFTTARMNDTSQPISIDFSDIAVSGGNHPWMHPTSCGISLTGHEHPHENVRGLLRMRNVSITETPAAGLCLVSKAAVGSMWAVQVDGLHLENVATSWPTPPVATTKNPYPCATVSYCSTIRLIQSSFPLFLR